MKKIFFFFFIASCIGCSGNDYFYLVRGSVSLHGEPSKGVGLKINVFTDCSDSESCYTLVECKTDSIGNFCAVYEPVDWDREWFLILSSLPPEFDVEKLEIPINFDINGNYNEFFIELSDYH